MNLRSSFRISRSVRALAAVVVVVATIGCDDGPATGECSDDADCASGHCVSSTCVACEVPADCPAGNACCTGECVAPAAFGEHCGCSPGPTAFDGDTCTPGYACLVGGVAPVGETLANASCDCTCTPGQGGTLCGPTGDGGAPMCMCSTSDDVTTCQAPSMDENNRPHRSADTCAPNEQCVCFAAGDVCAGEDGYDCTLAGCIDLMGDEAGCGQATIACTDPARSLEDGSGVCIQGGCQCDAATDCQGTGLAVDTCAFVQGGATTQCVCAGYRANGIQAACPLELACSPDGCVYNGTAYTEEAALVAALRN